MDDYKIKYEIKIFEVGSSLLSTVKAFKDYLNCGLKHAKFIVNSSPNRRDDYDTKEHNDFFKAFNDDTLCVTIEEDYTLVEFMISTSEELGFRQILENNGNIFDLNCLKHLREKKLGEILD